MMNKIIFLILIASGLIAQQIERGKNPNVVKINEVDSPEIIIEKAANVTPTLPQYNWQQLEFIGFVHFGINTFTDREWGEGNEDPKIFNPIKLDAEQWARTFKDAGMRMVILTAKHHDGFCLWPSKYTEHSVKNSPWKNGKGDVVREFVDACRKYKLKVGLYLSPWDRNNANYGDSPKYNQYFVNQLTELLTNYGEITEVWFDGACGEGPNGKRQVYDWQSYYKVIRKLQPNAVIFGMAPDLRWVGTETGYGRETEWNVIPIDLRNTDENFIRNSKYPLDQIYKPGDLTDADLGSREKILKAKGLYWYPAETDVSIRPGWFYHKSQDDKVKTPQQLIDIYFSSVGRNGVLLLNVPPNKDGLISYNDVVNLTEMKRGLDETFKINFAANALTKSTTMKTNKSSYWTTANKQDTASIIFNLQKLETFNVAMLQEEIRVGQRIEKFYLESWDGSKWNRFCEGTTVGYKRLLRFEQVKTDRVRLVIEKSRMNPTISNFGLFKMN